MYRFLIFWLLLAAVLAGPAASRATTSTSGNLAINVTPAPATVTNQTIESVAFSGSSVQFAASGPYYVGTLTTNLDPQTPTFNNLTGASYQLVASGGSCSGGDTTHFQIIGDGVYTNTLAAGTYTLCITASATGLTPYTATFAGITEGNKIDAATSYCAANGGGDGSSSPWQAACIQAAMNAASNGDTVYLASGNWELSTANPPATTSKSINLVGAGSGNTFNAYGQPNNASGDHLAATTSNNITRIYTSGTSYINGAGTGGYVGFSSCANVAVAHIFVDGSLATDGGGPWGTLNFNNCSKVDVNDIRVLAFSDSAISAEAQFWIGATNNVTAENSVFADTYVSGQFYPSAGVLEVIVGNYVTVTNSSF
jgi:hypothetical protein